MYAALQYMVAIMPTQLLAEVTIHHGQCLQEMSLEQDSSPEVDTQQLLEQYHDCGLLLGWA